MAADNLKKARSKFVEKVDEELIQQLLDNLLEDSVLNDGQKDSIWERNRTTADKARALIDAMRKKGNQASEIFIAHLQKKDEMLCAELGLSSAQPAQQAAEPRMEQNIVWSDTLIPITEDFHRSLSIRDIYPTNPNAISNRVALLITNIKFTDEKKYRNGAEKDEQNMEDLMKNLKYEVVKHRNLTGQEIDDALKEFAKHPKLKKTDSVLVVLMSHGKRDRVLGVNWKPDSPDEFPIDNIYKHLGPENCPALLNKPKIIIIQACRGENTGAVLVSDGASPASTSVSDAVVEEDIEDDNLRYEIKEKDFTSLLSSTPDAVSYRHVDLGSFLIQYVVEVFKTFACKDDIEELFRKVMQRFEEFYCSNKRQMPTKDRCTLTKKFYFFPGF